MIKQAKSPTNSKTWRTAISGSALILWFAVSGAYASDDAPIHGSGAKLVGVTTDGTVVIAVDPSLGLYGAGLLTDSSEQLSSLTNEELAALNGIHGSGLRGIHGSGLRGIHGSGLRDQAINDYAASDTQSDLVAIGRVDSVDSTFSSITILGQEIFVIETTLALGSVGELPEVGAYVAVSGELLTPGKAVASAVVSVPAVYIEGVSPTYVRALTETIEAAPHIKIAGELRIDTGNAYWPNEQAESALTATIEAVGYASNGELIAFSARIVPGQAIGTPQEESVNINSGSDLAGIHGSGLRGIHGSGLRGINGSGLRGINGSGLRGINGSGLRGINGSGLRGNSASEDI